MVSQSIPPVSAQFRSRLREKSEPTAAGSLLGIIYLLVLNQHDNLMLIRIYNCNLVIDDEIAAGP
ncbi:protein of unknown function [Candidatus Filomicrobium marinum]|uniref:Uncharacterized protein n=1 Tax=Candidatus Filomicrobium marinum TaxID=1608628 RepID=A0A0D6JDU7_9HYPH|nr:protein of unknown function [Candidatus Filomicrobium marinum]CPR17399.1 protein of unknown function [Candidatus Filomicrobium marinum]